MDTDLLLESDFPGYDIPLSNGKSINVLGGCRSLIEEGETTVRSLLGDAVPSVYPDRIIEFVKSIFTSARMKIDLVLDIPKGCTNPGDYIIRLTSCSLENPSH